MHLKTQILSCDNTQQSYWPCFLTHTFLLMSLSIRIHFIVTVCAGKVIMGDWFTHVLVNESVGDDIFYQDIRQTDT